MNSSIYSYIFSHRRKHIMTYKTKGVCASHIEFEVDDNKKVHNVRFIGGCSGNTQGVASLVEGMDAEEDDQQIKRNQMRNLRIPHVRISFHCTGGSSEQINNCGNTEQLRR